MKRLILFAILFLILVPIVAQDKIRDLLDEGIDLYKRGHYKKAYLKFEEALQKKPDSDLVYAWLKRTGEELILGMINAKALKPEDKEIIEKIRDMGKRLLELAKPGIHVKVDKKLILSHVKSLRSKDPQVVQFALFHLWHYGPYAVKYLVPELKDKDSTFRARVMLALKKIGYSATLALIEALNSKDKLMRQNSAIVLGNIKDTRAIAALKKILEDPNEDPQVKRYAKEAVLKITNEDPGKWKKAVDCYYDLAEKYYYSHPSVIPAWETAFLFWKWDEQRDILTEREVPSFAYNEQLAEEALFDLFKLDPSYKKGWKLLLMTYLAQYEEARIALEGSERSLAIGTLSEKELELLKRKLSNFERLKVLAGMIGKEAIYQALEETLGDNQAPKQKLRRNPLVARGCIKLLEELGDKNDLPPEKLDKEKDRRKYIGYPLVKALTDPDKRVRYAAAGCILKLSPREKRLGWQLVIPNLVDAIQETGVRVALIIYEVKDQKDYDVVNKLRKKLIMLGVFPVVASSAEEGLIRSRAFPGQDLILIQYKVASRVRIRETVNNKELVRENVFDAIRDDIRTKHIPKFMICDTDEELRNAKNVFLAHVKCFIKSDIEKLELRKHLEDLFAEGRAKEDAKARADMLAKEAAIALTTINPDTSAYPYKDTVASLIKASSPEILRKDSIRLPSIRALGNMRDKRAIPVLLRILDDKASDPAKVSRQKPIRLAAAQALSKIFKKNGYKLSKVEFALLKKYLYDGDLEIEFAVAKALANSALTDKERLELEEFRRLKRKAYTADE